MFLARYAFQAQFHIDLNDMLGLHFPSSPKFHWYQFYTYMFMHEGFEHIFFNMFAVWMFGYVLENYWGARRFIIFYVVTALGAAAIQTLYTGYEVHVMETFMAQPAPDAFQHLVGRYIDDSSITRFCEQWRSAPNDPNNASQAVAYVNDLMRTVRDSSTVGASGALFGILLAFGMLFPNTELMMLFFPVPIKAKYFVIIYGAIELFSGISQRQGDNIAHFAHLGGMLFGFILIKLWQKNRNYFY